MPLASLMLRHGRPERKHFYLGLEKLGYNIADFPLDEPSEDDLLVLWNRLPTQEDIAQRYEKAGAKIVIAEHAWIGDGMFSLCLDQHNGAGRWRVGRESRWPGFGIDVKPWRTKGEYILVIPQRGMGSKEIAQPRDWTEKTLAWLAEQTDRPIRVRYPQDRIHPLWPEFDNVHAAVIWASGAGVKAIAAGIPVFYQMPQWIGCYAARAFDRDVPGDLLEDPYLGERDTMFRHISWAMWKAAEIENGEAFRWLLS